MTGQAALRTVAGLLAAAVLVAASVVVVRDWRAERLLRRGSALVAEDAGRAERLLQRALAHGSADAALELARLSFGRQEWQGVHHFADEALRINPYLGYAHILRAHALAAERMPADVAEAGDVIALCRRAIATEPADGTWWGSCAELALRLYRHLRDEGEGQEAVASLRAEALDLYRRTLAFGGEESQTTVRSAAALGPEALFLVQGLGEASFPAIRETVRILLEQETWRSVREGYWEMATGVGDPRDFYRGAAAALREAKKYREVLTSLEVYDMREKEDAPLAWLLALSAEALGPESEAWPRAEAYYRRAVALDGDNRWYRRRLGAHLVRLERLEEAETILTELAAEYPRDHQSWFQLGRIARKRGDREAAMKHLRKAVELQPGNGHYTRMLHEIEKELP